MATVNQNALEELESRFAELITESNSLADDLAEMTVRAEAAEVELRRIKAAYPEAC